MSRRKIPAAEWTWSASRGRRVGRVCFLWATFLCTSKERCARAPKAGESSALALALALALAVAVAATAEAEARAFSPLRGASYFSLLVQRKDNQKRCFSTAEWLVKHTLPPRPRRYATRVHSASGIFRHDIPVVAKNDVHPCTSPFGFFPLAPSLRKGPGRSKAGAKARATATATATAKATPPRPSPALRAREGVKRLYEKGGRSGVTPGLCAASASLFQLHPVFAARPKQLHAQNHRRFE